MNEPARPAGFQGYDRVSEAEEDRELTHVGRGTPCGEYLRHYWQPLCMSEELGELPLLVRILCEDLVLFRDGGGRLGLLHRHCAHRGASLEYGLVAERGIVCCYHGWHYDVDGTLIRAGSEPLDGPLCQRVVQGAYPTHEHNGIIFAYLGPPARIPPFPVYDTELVPDTKRRTFSLTTPCNWLQVYENTQDPIHVLHLHARSSGVQFGVASGVDQVIEYRDSPLGMFNVQTRSIGARIWTRITESILPNGNQTGAIWEEAESDKYFQRSAMLRWMVPVDNTTTRTIGWRFFNEHLDPRGQDRADLVGKESIDFIGQTEDERSYAERQRQPGDFEAQVSQRPIAVHALENRATSDRGVVKLRRMLRERIRDVSQGSVPPPPCRGSAAVVPTYCQDTVCAWTGTAAPDRAALRAHGRRIAEAVLASAHLPADQRAGEIRRHCGAAGS
jgi:phenylpropionate dioxygenase-like ring-hydroxylating dioxygenase large terminal subunit